MINLFICFILDCLSSFRFHSSCWSYIFYFIYSISFRFIYLVSSATVLNIIFCFNFSFFNFTIRFLNFLSCSIIYSLNFYFPISCFTINIIFAFLLIDVSGVIAFMVCLPSLTIPSIWLLVVALSILLITFCCDTLTKLFATSFSSVVASSLFCIVCLCC